jgi:hypothetical protein
MRKVWCEGCGQYEGRQAFPDPADDHFDWPLWVQVAVMFGLMLSIMILTGMHS